MPSYTKAAPAVFLAAQSRNLPAIASLLQLGSTAGILEADERLRNDIAKARSALIEAGCRSDQVPFGAAAPSAPKRTRTMMKPQHAMVCKSMRETLPPGLAARFNAQASASASAWLHEPFPGGHSKPAGTWRTMMRQRLLMAAPGAAQYEANCRCSNRRQDGTQCSKLLDEYGLHELLCPLGGGVNDRHTSLRKWVADKLRDSYGVRVQEEKPVAPPEVSVAGRMDVVCFRGSARLLIDTVVATPATTDTAELARRRYDAARALNEAERRKRKRYGDAVLAFAVEDTGRIGRGARRLLRELAELLEDESPCAAFRRLLAEVQHVVLGSTAALLQTARGLQPTPG